MLLGVRVALRTHYTDMECWTTSWSPTIDSEDDIDHWADSDSDPAEAPAHLTFTLIIGQRLFILCSQIAHKRHNPIL